MKKQMKKFASLLLALLLCCGAAPFTHAAEEPEESFLDAVCHSVRAGFGEMRSILHPVMGGSGSLVAYTQEDLCTESTLIATGRFTGKSTVRLIHQAGIPEEEYSAAMIYTDYEFTVENAIKGTPYADTIAVRVMGGKVTGLRETLGRWGCIADSMEFIAKESPEFNTEDEYMLFLYDNVVGTAFETPDSHYYVCGVNQGVFTKNAAGDYRDMDGEIFASELLVSPFMDEEAAPSDDRQEQLETYKENYENGVITKELYDQLVADLDLYGYIVKSE